MRETLLPVNEINNKEELSNLSKCAIGSSAINQPRINKDEYASN